ncbi:hypothetical protein [Goodfellowiella coeruleoviolacea]|uniref:hypothetical protein n=1 Tax=Goodfellowiella coeruleoviolacea TaxID=334858 RepID=UPI0020A5DC4E|nr:hypothetical protein [Goodfellowiella coeruleoviolacea]
MVTQAASPTGTSPVTAVVAVASARTVLPGGFIAATPEIGLASWVSGKAVRFAVDC